MKRALITLIAVYYMAANVSKTLADDTPALAKAPFNADQAKEFQKQWAKHIDKDLVYTNSIGMKLSLIPPGEFTMGRTEEQFDKVLDIFQKEGRKPAQVATWELLMMPAHRVRITKPFYMGTTEVTVAQYRQFCEESGYKTEAERGLHGGKAYKGRRGICTWRKPMVWIKLKQEDDEPVLHLCWNDCVAFCKWLSEKESVEYCLPTEAEWEYACRAGATTAWSFGNFEDFDRLGHEYMFVSDGKQGKHDRPSRVAQKKPNAFGLYDMHGNVWEYVADWWHRYTYKNSLLNDPTGPPEQSEKGDMRRIIRTGSFDWGRWGAQSVYRMRITQRSTQHPHQGFRVAMRIKDVEGVPPAVDPDTERRSQPRDPGADFKVVDAALKTGAAIGKKLPKELIVKLNDTVKIEFVLIPAGTFLMGSDKGSNDEGPIHRVVISKPFYMAKYELTTSQWEAVMGKHEFLTKLTEGDNLMKGPTKAMNVLSWDDCQSFIKKLKTKSPDHAFALPTEAQWEYACRAGSKTEFHFGNDASKMGEYAWFEGNMIWPNKPAFQGKAFYHNVGTKKPNKFGLYDMHGGVWEWCADKYDANYYFDSPLVDPTGSESDRFRVLRGGSWFRYAKYCRSAYRKFFYPACDGDGITTWINDYGCRLVINPDDASTARNASSNDSRVANAPFSAERAKELQQHWSKQNNKQVVETNSIGMKLTLIPPGEFMMGSTEEKLRAAAQTNKESKWYQSVLSGGKIELPSHRVRITKPFYMGSTEVTVAQFRQFAEATGYKTEAERGLAYGQPANRKLRTWRETFYKQADNHPVLQLCQRDCKEFCKWLSQKEGREYHLPTEAQWEYACRAGSRTEYHFGDDVAKLTEYALVCADDAPPLRERDPLDTTVGRRKPNAFGVYDLHGSMWEWCVDRYGGDYYSAAPINDPQGPSDGLLRVLRGGSWFRYGRYARSVYRHSAHPDATSSDFGFRVVINAGPPPRKSAQGAVTPKPVAPSVNRSKPAINYTKLARSLVRYPNNPVIKVGDQGAWNDQTLGCFTVLDSGDQFYFYSGGAQFGNKKNVGMATSQDGIHWTYFEKNPLFPGSMPYAIKVGDTFRLYHPGDGGLRLRKSKDGFGWSKPTKVMSGCLDPCVIQVSENKFHLYFCGGGKIEKDGKQVWQFKNYVATSNDGITWNKQANPVLPLGPKGNWDEGSHAGPCVLKLPDGFHMWYLGSGPMEDKIAWRIGHATSPDGLTWTKSSKKPVLDVGKPGAWDQGTFMSFDIIFRNGKLLFWYAAAPTGHDEETKMKIQIGHGTSS